MRSDVLRAHLGLHHSRREVLGLAASAAVATAGLGVAPAAAEGLGEEFSDRMFTVDDVAGWAEQTARR